MSSYKFDHAYFVTNKTFKELLDKRSKNIIIMQEAFTTLRDMFGLETHEFFLDFNCLRIVPTAEDKIKFKDQFKTGCYEFNKNSIISKQWAKLVVADGGVNTLMLPSLMWNFGHPTNGLKTSWGSVNLDGNYFHTITTDDSEYKPDEPGFYRISQADWEAVYEALAGVNEENLDKWLIGLWRNNKKDDLYFVSGRVIDTTNREDGVMKVRYRSVNGGPLFVREANEFHQKFTKES